MSKPQLFCFTYAGGTASFFDLIEKDLSEFELVKPEYAGHGTRRNESYYQSFDELADDVFQIFKEQYKGGQYALFGYSMGTITVVEMLKRIIESKMIAPQHVFLAAHEPHTKSELVGFTTEEMDEWVKNRTIRFGAVPQVLLNNEVFWRTYLPVFRADYSIITKYRFEDIQLQTDIPATVFYSETDTPLSEIQQWQNIFIYKCKFYQYDGTHFFIQQHYHEIAEIIEREFNHDIR